MTIRYGLIGSGMMGQEHIRNINILEGCEVVAVADPCKEMRDLSKKTAVNDIQTFTHYKEMLAAIDLDALVIVAPNHTHHQILKDVISTDIPILCEKPLCISAADCRDIIALNKNSDVPIWVAMEYRYMPPIAKLIDEINLGTIGDPLMISIREHRFPFLDKVDNWNRFQNQTGGTLVEKCCHFWDLMRLVIKSRPIRVYASAGMDVNFLDEEYNGRKPDILDNAFVILDFENGARGMLDLCMFAEGAYWQEVVSVTGPQGRLDAKVPGPARFSVDGKERHSVLEISNRQSKEVTVKSIDVDESILRAGDHHGSTFFQHQHFRDLILSENRKPEVSIEDGLWSVLIGEAAELSAKTGRAIDLERI